MLPSAILAMRPMRHGPQCPCSQGAPNMKADIQYSYSLPTHYDCCQERRNSGRKRGGCRKRIEGNANLKKKKLVPLVLVSVQQRY